jgi:hypothetical protein
MSDDPLSGINVGDRDEDSGGQPEKVADVLEEFGAETISDLNDKQLVQAASQLKEEEELKGITQIKEEGERDEGIARQVARLRAELRREQVFEQQLEDLQAVGDQVELFRRMIASLANINNKLDGTNQLIADLVESTVRGQSLSIKEANERIVEGEGDVKDVVSDTDLTTSSVIIKSDIQNGGSLYIGSQEVQVGDGFKLGPGEKQIFPIDVVSEDFKITADEPQSNYSYIALGIGGSN